VMKVGARLVCGAAVVGPAAALLGAITTWFLTLRIQDAREPARAEARKRTLARYSRASLYVRSYVRSKLLIDPALESITALIGSFGRVVDAGSGFGQIGLSLLDRGRAASLVGIDSDPTRIEVARAAAGSSARFEIEELSEATFSETDTILFVDSLHYLPLATQDALLARSAAALSPGGRLIVREVASGPSFRSKLTERIERRAARRRGHSGALAFREIGDLVRVMEEQGLTCSAAEFEKRGILDNAFVVGEKPRDSA
jgi:SAM-dependent methyltransferase